MNIIATIKNAIDEELQKNDLGTCVSVGDDWVGFSPVRIDPPKEISDYFRTLLEALKDSPGFIVTRISITSNGLVEVNVGLIHSEE